MKIGQRLLPSDLRHPYENKVFAASVVVNILVIVFAVSLVIYGGAWLGQIPIVGRFSDEIRAAAVAILTVAVTLPFLRNSRHARVRGNSVRLSEHQLPAIYNLFKSQCEKLGLETMPELYLTDRAISGPSHAYSSWKHDYVVLATDYLDPNPEDCIDVIAFLLGSELGRLQLGHTTLLDELLLVYVSKVPYLRNPITEIRTYSRDRYGAYLAPDTFAGLVIAIAGRRVRKRINLEDLVSQARSYGGLWAWYVIFQRNEPEPALRMQRLLEAGFYKEAVASLDGPLGSAKSKGGGVD
jgi:hypothetical protein